MTPVRLMALAAVGAVACAVDAGPLDPIWGKQPCATCKMILSDQRFAAELLDQRGEHRFFDDIGCLDEYLRQPSITPAGLWVRANDRWVDARSTRYATGALSPMDYGFVPSASGELDFAAVRRAAVAQRQRKAP